MYRILVAFFLLPQLIIAQESRPSNIKGSVSGTLIDSITGAPIEYAAVGIINAPSGKVVNGSISGPSGEFVVGELAPGEYEIHISYIGYRPHLIRNIILTPKDPDFNAGDIILSPESQLLEEVLVLGEAALIEARPDKIIYNAERDVTSSGGDASEVLRKVPLLSVDLDGNVSLRGSENVKILINGRPSSIFNSNVADALKMMPADQIKSVEVITSPSAKFDGEGTAGIINIITRKKNVEGTSGNIDLTAGTRAHRANGNLNYGKGRLGLNVSAGGHYNIPQDGATSLIREEFISEPTFLSQEGISNSSRSGFRLNAGLEYNFNPRNAMNASMSYRGFENNNKNNLSTLYSINDLLIEQYERISEGISSRTGWDLELDYKKDFNHPDQEWSVAVEVDKDDHLSDYGYHQQYLIPDSIDATDERNLNESDNLEITLQTDYVHPLHEKIKLETGAKATLRKIVSDFSFHAFDPDLGIWNEDPVRTDIFTYDQNVYAGYLSSTFTIGKTVSLIAGVRAEWTSLQGTFERLQSPFKNDYLNLLPSITLSKRAGELNQLKISYHQRIQRPNQRHINPFIEYNDSRDISFGNPSLSPEIVHQLEIGTNYFIKGNMISTALFVRRTDDLIENILIINDEGISESTYYNFGGRSSIGLNVFGTLNLGDLSLRGGFDVNAWEVKGDFEEVSLSNSGYDFNGRLNITWAISETFRMEGFTFYRSPTFTVQGKTPNWSMMSLGIKKELFQKRLSVGINITEPFRENLIFIRELEGPEFYQYGKTERPVRSFGVNLGYRFGKLDFRERTGRKKVNNNDLKDEEQGNESQF